MFEAQFIPALPDSDITQFPARSCQIMRKINMREKVCQNDVIDMRMLNAFWASVEVYRLIHVMVRILLTYSNQIIIFLIWNLFNLMLKVWKYWKFVFCNEWIEVLKPVHHEMRSLFFESQNEKVIKLLPIWKLWDLTSNSVWKLLL